MAVFSHPDFEHFVRSPRAFDLVFEDDLTVRVVPHPDGARAVLEAFVCDAARLVGAQRQAVVDALLILNDAGLGGRSLVCGLDSRDFVTVHAQAPLAGLDAARFADALDHLLRQARRVRELVRSLSFQGVAMRFALQPAYVGERP